MGSKPCSVIIHEAFSKCNVATIHIQLYLLKNVLALQSFATHHLCENPYLQHLILQLSCGSLKFEVKLFTLL